MSEFPKQPGKSGTGSFFSALEGASLIGGNSICPWHAVADGGQPCVSVGTAAKSFPCSASQGDTTDNDNKHNNSI